MIDVSPSGDRIAYVVNNQLYVRHVSEHDAIPVRGTTSLPVTNPVFSPDGQSIAFYSVGEQADQEGRGRWGNPADTRAG